MEIIKIKDWSGMRSNGIIYSYSNGYYYITHRNGKVEKLPESKFKTVEELYKYVDNIKDSIKTDDKNTSDYYSKLDRYFKSKYPGMEWEMERVGYARVYDPKTMKIIKSGIPVSSILLLSKDSVKDSYWEGRGKYQKEYEELRKAKIDIPGSYQYYRWYNDGDYPAGLGANRSDYSNWAYLQKSIHNSVVKGYSKELINGEREKAKIWANKINNAIENTMDDRIHKLYLKHFSNKSKDSIKDKLIPPTKECLREVENIFKKLGWKIDKQGDTMFGKKHYLIKMLGSGYTEMDLKKAYLKLDDELDKIDAKFHCRSTCNVGLTDKGEITAGVDIDEMYIRDSVGDAFKLIEVVKKIKKQK